MSNKKENRRDFIRQTATLSAMVLASGKLFQSEAVKQDLSDSSAAKNSKEIKAGMRNHFKLAMVQMYVEPGKKEVNLDHAEKLIKASSENGANVVLLPEVMNLGWTNPTALAEADEIPGGITCSRLSEAARKYKVFICAGLAEKDGNSIYNSAVIINEFGQLLTKHRKLNELIEVADDVYAQGDRLNVCLTPFGTFGLHICADATAKDHVLTRSLCYMGADVILSPSSWAVEPDHDNKKTPYGDTWRNAYIPVAREFSVWIAGCTNVGPITEGKWKRWKCIGCSLVIDPCGNEVVQGPYGEKAETIIYVDITPIKRPTWGTGWDTYKSLGQKEKSKQ